MSPRIFHASSTRFTTNADCIPRSAISARCSSRINTPATGQISGLISVRPEGPTPKPTPHRRRFASRFERAVRRRRIFLQRYDAAKEGKAVQSRLAALSGEDDRSALRRLDILPYKRFERFGVHFANARTAEQLCHYVEWSGAALRMIRSLRGLPSDPHRRLFRCFATAECVVARDFWTGNYCLLPA